MRYFTPLFLCALVLLAGCRPSPPAPLLQRGYLWQRDWTPAVLDAVGEADRHLDGVVLLGAEIVWKEGLPVAIRANIPWEKLRTAHKTLAVALRVAPFSGPFASNDDVFREIAAETRLLIAAAKTNGVALGEFQLDFDCPQKKLAGYRVWLQSLRPIVSPLKFVITALPVWLGEPAFPALAKETDGYVLQVHSVPTAQEIGRATLCDPVLARRWVAQAENIGLPFAVALPTYRCIAGYNSAGRHVGTYMDGIQPIWGNEVHLLEFAADPVDLAALIQEWQASPRRSFREVLWYRVPVASDGRNWPWITLSAVMAGRPPKHHLEVNHTGTELIDLSISNTGEIEEWLDRAVEVTWTGGTLLASDALPDWKTEVGGQRVIFFPNPPHAQRLSPGAKSSIGWLRYDRPPSVQIQLR